MKSFLHHKDRVWKSHYLYISVCRFVKGNVRRKFTHTCFCLVNIKKHSFLTSCVFWFVWTTNLFEQVSCLNNKLVWTGILQFEIQTCLNNKRVWAADLFEQQTCFSNLLVETGGDWAWQSRIKMLCFKLCLSSMSFLCTIYT